MLIQCIVQHEDGKKEVAHLPEEFAKVGNRLKISEGESENEIPIIITVLEVVPDKEFYICSWCDEEIIDFSDLGYDNDRVYHRKTKDCMKRALTPLPLIKFKNLPR